MMKNDWQSIEFLLYRSKNSKNYYKYSSEYVVNYLHTIQNRQHDIFPSYQQICSQKEANILYYTGECNAYQIVDADCIFENYLSQNILVNRLRSSILCKEKVLCNIIILIKVEILQMEQKIGLGTWKCENKEVQRIVYDAIRIGYRYFDCAFEYGNEYGIGKGIQQAIDEGLVKREDLFIATKLWQTYHRPDLVEEQLQLSLKNLNLSFIDLFIIHWPLQFVPGEDLYPRVHNQIQKDKGYTLQDTWRAMEKLVDSTLVRNIGVSNYNVQLMSDLISYSRIKPYSNQIEIHPFLQQTNLIDFCIENEIKITAYSPIGGNYDYGVNKNISVQNHQLIVNLAHKHNTTPVDIIISWHLQKHQNSYQVVPKSSNYYRIQQNFTPSLSLSTEDIISINSLDISARLNDAGKQFWETPVFD